MIKKIVIKKGEEGEEEDLFDLMADPVDEDEEAEDGGNGDVGGEVGVVEAEDQGSGMGQEGGKVVEERRWSLEGEGEVGSDDHVGCREDDDNGKSEGEGDSERKENKRPWGESAAGAG